MLGEVIVVHYISCLKCLCVAGKKRKSRSELPEAFKYLQDMERSSEERQEERELKRRKMELEVEERREQAGKGKRRDGKQSGGTKKG